MKDILDGKYIGELTPEQVVEQYEYRAGIHLSYINLMNEQPNAGWEAYGSEEWHNWAVNGYQWGIKHIQDNTPILVYQCSLGEAFATILRPIANLFGR